MIRTITVNGKQIVGYAYELPTTLDLANELISKERLLRQLNGGYQVNGKWFHSDEHSKLQQIGLVMLGANIDPTLLWKTMDGSFVPMNAILAQQILLAGAKMESDLFNKSESLRNLVKTEGIDYSTIDYFSGWAKCYWEV